MSGHRRPIKAKISIGNPRGPVGNPVASGWLNATPGPTGINDECSMEIFGPQTFAELRPGTEMVNACLFGRNRDMERRLKMAADRYYEQEDFRWFFAYAHAKITGQINDNIKVFQRPNALIRLNLDFAEQFLGAVEGNPHKAWKQAFRACKALEEGSKKTMVLIGEVEFCGAAMASVHIKVDLAAALQKVGCIPPADYANMLVFVNRGSLAATVKLRGHFLGVTEVIAEQFVAPLADLEIKAWRNAVYLNQCHIPVPEVESDFVKRLGK